jgi:hypothetical protein
LEEWTLPHILALRAETHGSSVYLDVPSAGVTLTFAETLDEATRMLSYERDREVLAALVGALAV